jgi:hypothetical protein
MRTHSRQPADNLITAIAAQPRTTTQRRTERTRNVSYTITIGHTRSTRIWLKRGADWILTVKANQPTLHPQLAALPWRTVPDAARDTGRGHGRREIRTLKILTIAAGIEFPHATQALLIRRRRHRSDQPKRFTTETVYAITNLRVHEAKPAQIAAWIRHHWHIENQIHWVRDVTYDEDRSQIRTGTGPQVMAALRNAAIRALRLTGVTDIAAANRHHPRDSTRPLALLGIT